VDCGLRVYFGVARGMIICLAMICIISDKIVLIYNIQDSISEEVLSSYNDPPILSSNHLSLLSFPSCSPCLSDSLLDSLSSFRLAD